MCLREHFWGLVFQVHLEGRRLYVFLYSSFVLEGYMNENVLRTPELIYCAFIMGCHFEKALSSIVIFLPDVIGKK